MNYGQNNSYPIDPNTPAMMDPRLSLGRPTAQPMNIPQGVPPHQMIPNRPQMNPIPPTNQFMPQQVPQQQVTSQPSNTSLQPEAASKAEKVAEVLPKVAEKQSDIPRVGKTEAKAVDPYTERQLSENPLDRVESIDMLARAATKSTKKLSPSMKSDLDEINSKYSLGEIDGESVYQCPLTQKPCSKKTFWQRLKEFFLHSIGQKSQEEKDTEIAKLDAQDPIVKKYGNQPLPQISQQPHQFNLQDYSQPIDHQTTTPLYNPMAMEGGLA